MGFAREKARAAWRLGFVSRILPASEAASNGAAAIVEAVKQAGLLRTSPARVTGAGAGKYQPHPNGDYEKMVRQTE